MNEHSRRIHNRMATGRPTAPRFGAYVRRYSDTPRHRGIHSARGSVALATRRPHTISILHGRELDDGYSLGTQTRRNGGIRQQPRMEFMGFGSSWKRVFSVGRCPLQRTFADGFPMLAILDSFQAVDRPHLCSKYSRQPPPTKRRAFHAEPHRMQRTTSRTPPARNAFRTGSEDQSRTRPHYSSHRAKRRLRILFARKPSPLETRTNRLT